jgi:hypothetical protein
MHHFIWEGEDMLEERDTKRAKFHINGQPVNRQKIILMKRAYLEHRINGKREMYQVDDLLLDL